MISCPPQSPPCACTLRCPGSPGGGGSEASWRGHGTKSSPVRSHWFAQEWGGGQPQELGVSRKLLSLWLLPGGPLRGSREPMSPLNHSDNFTFVHRVHILGRIGSFHQLPKGVHDLKKKKRQILNCKITKIKYDRFIQQSCFRV